MDSDLERYRQYVELSNEGIWALDAGFRTTFANPAMACMLDYSVEEMMGRPLTDFVFEEERDTVQQVMQNRKAGTDSRRTLERRYRRKDGSACWGLVTATWMYDEKGKALGTFAMISDITERKRVEQALTESRETFRMLVESSPTAIGIVHDANILYANPALARLTGYTLEELCCMKIGQVMHPDFTQLVNDRALARQHGEAPPSHYELKMLSKRGDTLWADLSAARVIYEGRPCTLGTMLDITERKLAETVLKESEARYHTLFDRAGEGIILVTTEGKLLAVNEAFARMHGYSREEILSMSLRELDTAESRAKIPERMRQIREHGALTFEVENYHKNGHVFPMEVSANLVTLDGQEVVQSFCRDITVRKRVEEQLKLSAMVLENASEGVVVTDENNNIVATNPAFSRITGFSFEDVVGQNPRIFSSGLHDREFYRTMWRDILENGHWEGEIWDRNKSGTVHAKHLSISLIRKQDGNPYRFVALFTDITDRKQSEELIWRQANFDMLTDLPNRQMFHDRLDQEAKKCHRSGKPMALLLIDLDRFKEVNDTLGHHQGDKLLVDAARRIVECVRESDTVARLGGDEFVVILSELDDVDSVERIAAEIIRKFSDPFMLDHDKVYGTTSIGISLYPDDTEVLDDLLKNADQAMYSAKNAGRNRFCYFTRDMQEAALKRLRMAGDLRAAVDASQFHLHYQPIVELISGRIRKAEALIRWQHPERGTISPTDFIPLAEDTGLIVPIGEWVFREAVRQTLEWRNSHDTDLQISINKSPVQVRNPEAGTAAWPAYMAQQGLPGSALSVEITEGLLMDPGSEVNAKLQLFHQAGIELSIDDFGTGYSSLAYLRQFDVDYLKIDRTFIHDLENNTHNQALCEAIIVMAHKLGMKVIAEGVETPHQRDLLLASGCDYGQGFLFSRPLPPDEFEKLLARAR